MHAEYQDKRVWLLLCVLFISWMLPGCRLLEKRKSKEDHTTIVRGGYLTRMPESQLSSPDSQAGSIKAPSQEGSSGPVDDPTSVKNLSKEALINKVEELKQELAEEKEQKNKTILELKDLKSDYGRRLFQLETSLEKEKKESRQLKDEFIKEQIRALKAEDDLNQLKVDLLSKKAIFDSHYPAYYEVAKGDSLWKIAAKENIYGNGYKWMEIYHENQSKILNQDLIYPGMVIRIPRYIEMMMQGVSSQPKPVMSDQEENNRVSQAMSEMNQPADTTDEAFEEDLEV